MKSKKKQRILALLLSMVLMLSASISAMAEGDAQNEASGTETTENQAAAQSLEEETVPETEVPGEENGITVQSLEGSEEPVQETEESVEEVPAETTVPAEESSQEYVPQPEISDQTGVENIQIPEDAVTVEETPEQEQPEEVISPATELKQEFTDENGNVTQTVTAYLPEGAFQATADQISMEVKLLNEDDTNYIKGMMEEKLPEGFYLDGYVLYQIDFKVNGEITRPAKAITISMTGNELAVEDTKKAHVFYYVPEDPEVEGDKDQLTEVIQKDQMIQSLEESGQSTENIEDYDYAEIAVNNGNADTVTVKGWESTIYGCYAEKEAVTELSYEDDSVTITVSADKAGIIPKGAELSVTPIVKTEITNDMSAKEKAQAKEINEQYAFTEEKLQADSEEKDETMEGFLAYDISFLVDGEEVEPGGEVRVIMEFKEAAIPEGVSENVEVAVKHLKEEATAEDGVVVEDMAEKVSVETTDVAAVEKIELQSDSFSTYTITWVSMGRNLELKYVDTNRRDIAGGRNGKKKMNENEIVQLEDYETEIPDYAYSKTYVVAGRNEIEVDAVRVVRKDNYYPTYQVQYQIAETGEWEDWNVDRNNSYTVYYEYVRTADFDVTPITTTQDTNGKIDLKLFDYDGTVGNMRNFQFGNGDGSGANKWTGSEKVYPGILQKNMLTDGRGNYTFPQFSLGFGNDQFSQLFSDTELNNKKVYDANRLFTLDDDGYYEYDSSKNYAYYNKDTKEFTVYNVPATVKDYSSSNGTAPGFFPFNRLETTRRGEYYTKDGYICANNNDETNFWFGMSMASQFVQPENGEVNENDMIFEFSGDDDVWVFIDGVLVLDIGGIHNEASGSINFKTGEVYVNGASQGSLKDLFNSAGRDVSTGFTGETFENYSAHTINFYYLERGRGASNCRMKFNLQIIPEGEIQIEKRLEEETDPLLYGDVEFGFELYVEESDGEGQGNGKLQQVTTTSENSYGYGAVKKTASGEEEPLSINENGIFYLKPGETAIFKNIPKNLNYKVIEVDIQSDKFDEVYVNSTKVTESYSDESQNIKYEADSGEDKVGERPWLIFTNSCNAKNLRTLTIEKKMKAGQESDGSFIINVQLEGNDGELTAFSGSYRLMNENGKTIDASGNLQHDTFRLTTTDGKVQLKAGWKALIYNILSDTDFKVTEENLDYSVYSNPLYGVSIDGENSYTENAESAAGTIQLDKHAFVVITNSLTDAPDTPYIKVQKTFEGLNDPSENLEDFQIALYEEKDIDLSNPVATLRLSDSENLHISEDGLTYTWTIYNLPAGTYTVKETGFDATDYILDKITVNGIQYESNIDEFKNVLENGVSVSTQTPTYTLSEGKRINPNNELEIELPFKPNIVAGALTGQAGYFVWSEDTLSLGERTAIISMIKTAHDNGNFGNITEQNTAFFSTEEKIEDGIDYRGTVSLKQENDQIKLIFSESSQWKQIYYGSYEKNGSVNAEVELINSYKPETAEIDLQKYGTRYDTGQISGAQFSLYEQKEGNSGYEWVPVDGYKNFEVETNKVELTLKAGFYRLEEILAPAGYQKLSESIYFKVSEGKAVLTDKDGNPLVLSEEEKEKMMWKADSDGTVIKIKNNIVYDLPSAGGPGIFLYMIGGTLLLMAGSLMIYINRRKGVLEK